MPIYTNYAISNSTSTNHKTNLLIAIKTFFKNDNYLVGNDLHEVSLSHRLAIYLDEIYPNYNVDCEWNRNIGVPKRIFTKEIISTVKTLIDVWKPELNKDEFDDKLLEELIGVKLLIDSNKERSSISVTDLSGDEFLLYPETDENGRIIIKNVRPDIVIHHRGTHENISVIEIKKKNAGSSSAYKKAKNFDLIKLYALTTQGHLKYDVAFYIEFPEANYIWKKIKIEKSKFIDILFGQKVNKVYEVTFL